VKVIQLLKHQKQHCKPLLKIAEKPDNFFAMALFFMYDTVTVKFAHAIAWVVEGEEIRSGRRSTFGTDIAIPFVALLPV
jgi:hypothetical protein